MKFNLKKRLVESTDFSFHKTHKLGAVVLPSELLFLSPILDEGLIGECTACSGVSARFNEVNNIFLPQQGFWAQEIAFAGVTEAVADKEGFDIQVPAATAVKSGFPNYNPSAYFWITPGNGNDLFDNARIAISTFQRPAVGGLTWYKEWVNAPQGLISSQGTQVLGGHCVKLAGWKTINGVLCMVIQNSWGNQYGDNGLYYMPREIFNTAFAPYGIFYWTDGGSTQIKTLGLIQALYQNILTILKSFGQKAGYPPPPPSLLVRLSQGIFEAEGNGKQVGAKQNNWGDLRYTKYTASLGATGMKNGFAVFPTQAIGNQACVQLCTDVADNLLLGYPKPCTLSEFVKVYAQPETQAEWDNYLSILLRHTGKVGTDTLTSLK